MLTHCAVSQHYRETTVSLGACAGGAAAARHIAAGTGRGRRRHVSHAATGGDEDEGVVPARDEPVARRVVARAPHLHAPPNPRRPHRFRPRRPAPHGLSAAATRIAPTGPAPADAVESLRGAGG